MSEERQLIEKAKTIRMKINTLPIPVLFSGFKNSALNFLNEVISYLETKTND